MAETQQGQRLPDAPTDPEGIVYPDGYSPSNEPPAGGYWIGAHGRKRRVWYCTTPNGHVGCLASHNVTEHEDGTITVSPSILVTHGSDEVWHGYLERGVWRSV